ncbi:MAG: peptide-methionine (S)-S-oxide reductase MsrA [Flammeovirgaceae bacterium]|nr:peptide-methionine (S)-S-oxide reductase MsrA [Flammeovirgaceae bacterium]
MVNLSMKLNSTIGFIALTALAFHACGQSEKLKSEKSNNMNEQGSGNLELATFGSGCFWCTEAIFQNVDGVEKVVSGYTGGKVKNPTYKEVCSGLTGHAEVIQLSYNPAKVTFDELLEIFWKTHDPTTLNRQGADVGTQYRSAIFFHNENQKSLAEKYKKELDTSGAFDRPIVTEITAATTFYPAENYHQNYFNENSDAPYCSFVIQPKLEKFKKVFKAKLKTDMAQK